MLKVAIWLISRLINSATREIRRPVAIVFNFFTLTMGDAPKILNCPKLVYLARYRTGAIS
jgi:hypothetical protein